MFGQPYSQTQGQALGQTAQTYEQNAPQTPEQPQEEAAKKKKKKQKKEKKQKVVPAPTVEFDKGCCGAAWADIRATKRWFGKLLILALIRFIPIINWVINGYALRWSRELMLGRVEGMPKKTFCKRAFANGAMVFLISLIVGVIIFALTLGLGFVPIVGGLLAVLLTILINMIMNFCYIRMAIFDQLGEGFAINKGFDCIRRQFGKALCIEILPKLIIGVIICLIVGIFIALFVAINGNAIYNEILNFANQYSSWRAFEYAIQTDIQAQMELGELIVKNLVLCTPWLIGCVFLTNACNCLTTLIKTRACGHFVTRYCSDWTQEPKFATVLQCEEVQPSVV